ncbi:hypothetical protein [Nocardia niwae]|uniref:Uncharacterized protein n=1 Tax=Nocardia niwae TaxID=626084 RepID=A0ABV2X9D4_9NOCA|nr:hypothetical protein [Nocardia niwae]
MANNALPHRNPFVGPPAAAAVDVPADVVDRFLNALHEWQFEQTHTDQPDQEV